MSHQFALDDINFYVDLFDQFGIDVSMMVQDNYTALDQIDPERLDLEIESQLERDASYQFEEWIKKDRAFEAIHLIENDGHSHGLDGRISRLSAHAENKRRPSINLIKGNRDRIISQLSSSSANFNAYPNSDIYADGVKAMNGLKDNILDDNNFVGKLEDFTSDGASYGSGVFYVGFKEIYDSPDLALLGNKIAQNGRLTFKEYQYLQRALKNHQIEYVPTFEMIRYRGAKGEKARDFNHPSHRWTHRVRQIPVAQARREFPEFAEFIAPRVHNVYADTNPESYFHQDIDDTITKMETYVKFLVTGTEEIDVINPIDGSTLKEELKATRYAVAKFTRLEGVGLVDADIDKYHHNRFPFVQWIYTPSQRHSCGIGSVKYGRDPMIIHNMLHAGMLEYLAVMAKGGGFVDERLGLTQDQLNARTRPGTYVPVKIPVDLQGKTLKDLVVDSRPPAFPSVYSELMAIESRAIDEAMSVPNVLKGIQTGSSGKQEAILQNQADLVHSLAISNLKKSWHPLAIILYSNIVQYEDQPLEFFRTDPTTGERTRFVINMPIGWYMDFDAKTMQTEARPSRIQNELSSLMFNIQVETRDIVPHKPAEKALFYQNFFTQTAGFIQEAKGRMYLRMMNKYGFRLPGIDEALDRIDQIEAQQLQQQLQLAQAQQQTEQKQKDREFALDKSELALKEKELLLEANEAALQGGQSEVNV